MASPHTLCCIAAATQDDITLIQKKLLHCKCDNLLLIFVVQQQKITTYLMFLESFNVEFTACSTSPKWQKNN